MIPSIAPGLTLVNGTVGSGKTSLVWHIIMRELDAGSRVITNIAFNPDLDERLEKIEVLRDIIIPLEERDEAFSDLDEIGEWNAQFTEGRIERPGLLRGGEGLDALIVIDEAQDWFAFPGSKCPPELVRCLNLIRKRGVRLVLITPSAEDLAAAVRRKAIHRIVCEDLSTRPRIMPFLPSPPLFRWSRYRGTGTRPVESSIWFPKSEVLATYASTGRTAGIEFGGSELDVVTSTERRKRAGVGLMFGSVVLAVLAAGLVTGGTALVRSASSRVIGRAPAVDESRPWSDSDGVPAYVRVGSPAPAVGISAAAVPEVEASVVEWVPPVPLPVIGADGAGRPIYRLGPRLLRDGRTFGESELLAELGG